MAANLAPEIWNWANDTTKRGAGRLVRLLKLATHNFECRQTGREWIDKTGRMGFMIGLDTV